MAGIQKKDILSIDGLIAPERIKAGDDGVYIFDKINMDEGRLYKFDSDFKNHELIMEMDGDLCTYGRDGYIYIACIDENTGIEVYTMNGEKIRELEIPGIVYSIDVDEKGSLYVVTAEEKAMNVCVYNKEGKFINTLHSRNMPILSSLCCQEDSMYLGGVISNAMLRVEKVNWMSYIECSFDINAPGTNYMVSKITKSGRRIIAVLSGEKGDFLAFIDMEDGDAHISPLTIDGINSISDICLKGNVLYILSDDKKAALYDIEGQTEQISMKSEAGKRKNAGRPEKKYIHYIVWIKNLPKNFIKYYLKSAGPLTALLLAIANFILYREGSKISLVEYTGIFAVLSTAVCIFATAVKNVLDFGDCRSRIDNVLDVYNRIDAISSTILKGTVFIGIVVTLSMLFTGFKAVSLLTGVCTALTVYGIGLSSLKKLRSGINDMVFELLSLDADEYELFKMIRSKVRELKKTGIEKIRIKADVKNGIDKKTIWQIRRWSNLRRKITGGQSVLRENSNGLDFVINLKNRDIRYSALSVIEDFICYIGNNVNLSSIVIETAEDKSEEGK